MAAAMLAATSRIRVGVGALAADRRPPADVAKAVIAASLPLDRLVLVVGAGMSTSLALVKSAVEELRAALGPEATIGVAAMGPRMCRLGGEIADVVQVNWMNPERIAWAREQILAGARNRSAGLAASEPEVASYVRVSFGQGAALRVGAEAARYASMPQYARNFAAMGVASVGIAAPDPALAPAMLDAYAAVLDEAIVRPIVTMPAAENPDLNDVFEALGVLMEVASAFAPVPATEGASE